MMCFRGLAERESGVFDGEMMCFRGSAERESGVFDGAKWRFQEPAEGKRAVFTAFSSYFSWPVGGRGAVKLACAVCRRRIIRRVLLVGACGKQERKAENRCRRGDMALPGG
jgi:hypothetical protein